MVKGVVCMGMPKLWPYSSPYSIIPLAFKKIVYVVNSLKERASAKEGSRDFLPAGLLLSVHNSQGWAWAGPQPENGIHVSLGIITAAFWGLH